MVRRVLAALFLSTWLAVAAAATQDAHGRVTFDGRPVPGAVVTATRDGRRVTTVSDLDGRVRFTALEPGAWTIRIDMPGFALARGAAGPAGELTIAVPPAGPPPEWPLRLLSLEEIPGSRPEPVRRPSAVGAPAADEPTPADVFVVNGSVNNAAASPFAQPRGFGNNRPQPASLYSGTVAVGGGDSRLDARPHSFGSEVITPASHVDVQIGAAFGGPLEPWPRDRTAPRFFVAYQGSTRQDASTESLRVPTVRERSGDFSQTLAGHGRPVVVVDPRTGAGFEGGVIPGDRISPEAARLLALYPLPQRDATDGSNLDAVVTSVVRQDDFQGRVTHAVGRNVFLGTVALQRARLRTRGAFGFEDDRRTIGVDVAGNWTHRFTPRRAIRLRAQHTTLSAGVTPFFANRLNVSGEAGITGNDQTPEHWGPPRLLFPDVAALAAAAASHERTQTDGLNVELYLNRGRHTIAIGGDARRVQRDPRSQQDARGTFTFTGDATSVPFADFLLGLPASSAIGAGNAGKRFRSRSFTAYVSDEARVRPTVTLTLGVRWEFDTPYVEAEDRLATLDVLPDFSAVAPVTSGDGVGPLTGRRYTQALVDPDWSGVQPRVAASWRPIAGSSFVVRAGYGIYRNTGLYTSLASVLAEQPPFSRTALVARSDASPITLADGFAHQDDEAIGTFAVDPDVRVGFAQTWQVSVQRDLPASLFAMASYLGSRGHHLLQQTRPNTVPPGGLPCGGCPVGFVYVASNGRASRHALQLQLRRRLRGGFAASAQYTLANARDDASTFAGGVPAADAVAQDWTAPGADWSASSFDQRQVLAADVQYTAGVGRGAFFDGWPGALVRGWTVAGTLTAGSGLPFTPVYLAALPGSGFVGLRPDPVASSLAPAAGRYADPAAFAAPPPGQWGRAARNSIRGPDQLQFDLRVLRAFAWGDRRSVELSVDVMNVLNRVTVSRIHTVVGSSMFGLPSAAQPMRKIHTSFRVRF